jgi:hypothetical protein
MMKKMAQVSASAMRQMDKAVFDVLKTKIVDTVSKDASNFYTQISLGLAQLTDNLAQGRFAPSYNNKNVPLLFEDFN